MNFKRQFNDILWKGEDNDEENKVEILEVVSSSMLFCYLWKEFKENKTHKKTLPINWKFLTYEGKDWSELALTQVFQKLLNTFGFIPKVMSWKG